MTNAVRPDPDQLLDDLRAQDAQAARGKLTIFFGACAGVGKTYAMLQAARAAQAEGREVLIGIVETHGRAETAALLAGLPILPSRKLQYRDRLLAEFDLDAALATAPGLIVVDELAHSNVEGSRHRKRWQDVEELLSAGIDVYSALNVQHLDSLNDVVASITGVKVSETVPDPVFDGAHEVRLVDLPPDELLARLAAGKVYLPDAAERAAKNFFRKGNLIALREMALRRTADRVDAQMRAWRGGQRGSQAQVIWEARERLIAALGGSADDEKLVRETARLAGRLQSEWLAVHVEVVGMAEAQQRRVLKAQQLAESLGAEVVSLPGADVAETLARYARRRNATKIVCGARSTLPGWGRWRLPTAQRLVQLAPDLDVVLVGLTTAEVAKARQPATLAANFWQRMAGATAAVVLSTLLSVWLLGTLDLANVVMVYLLVVALAAAALGRAPGVWAAALSVASFNFFFVPPRWTFSVSDPQYLITFGILFGVALLIGQLAARLREQARDAAERERRASALAELARELSGALQVSQIIEISRRHLGSLLDAQVEVLVPHLDGTLRAPEGSDADLAVAQWVLNHQQEAGAGTATLAAASARYLPLNAPMRVRGVLRLSIDPVQRLASPSLRRLIDACCAQIAMALERVHYVEVAQDALVNMEGERMRNALLAAVSHDLRTPLTALVGLASAAERATELAKAQSLAGAIREEAEQLNRLVANLLDMARMQTGGIKLRKDWHSLQEVTSSAIAQLRVPLARFALRVDVPSDLALVQMDALLIERVVVNLLDNACKYGRRPEQAHGQIMIQARVVQAAIPNGELTHEARLIVEDHGPGLPAGDSQRLFAPFARGTVEDSVTGVGLGLALCEQIVRAHGGNLQAETVAAGGARFTLSLPTAAMPSLESAETLDAAAAGSGTLRP
jgi:two-component system sensor histidine kinase KdpD